MFFSSVALFACSVTLGVSLLIDFVAAWGFLASCSGVGIVLSHSAIIIRHVLGLCAALRISETDEVVGRMRFLARIQALACFARFLATLGAAVALPLSAVTLSVKTESASLQDGIQYLAAGSGCVALVANFITLAIRVVAPYRLDPCFGRM